MSGFCGFVGKSENTVLSNMATAINHTNAYEQMLFSDGYIHLGFVPYTEEDVQKVGHNENFTVWAMVESGRDKKEFEASEIIAAYEEKGISFVKSLEGTFSIVLWDGLKKRLYLIRDRYGAKPLYYAKCDNDFIFGTEVKAILKHKAVKREMNAGAVYQYLSHQSIYLPNTAFENIFHISAGCYGKYEAGKFEEVSYCELPFGYQTEDDYDEAVEKIQAMLEQSIKDYSCEDMGVFLSGGLDSGLVTALSKEGNLKYAFCLEPATKKDTIHRKRDDAFYSKELAKQYGLKSYVWQMTAEDMIASVDEVIKAFDAPFAGTMSTYFLADKAKEICKNILTGDGADELFGGYRHQTVLMPLEKYTKIKKMDKNPFGLEKEFAPYKDEIQLLESLYQFSKGDETFVRYRLLLMTDEDKTLFFNPELFHKYSDEKCTLKELIRQSEKLKSHGVLNRSLERDFLYLLPGHTMLYTDALTRKWGIRIKTPFLDNRLASYVAKLPQGYKMKDGCAKAILKSVGNELLPKEIIGRKKEPFSLPIVEWMREDLKEYVTDVLCMDSVKRHGILNPLGTEYVLREYYKNPISKSYYGQILWTMAMLERWISIYM